MQVRLESLAAAVAESLRDAGARGVHGYREIEAMAARHNADRERGKLKAAGSAA